MKTKSTTNPVTRRKTMKTIVIVSAALAALVATPALAQSNYGHDRSAYGFEAPRVQQNARGAFAQSNRGALNNRNVVIEDGKVIGADPDPNVRLQIRRDYEASDF
jgi:hypothetical protein